MLKKRFIRIILYILGIILALILAFYLYYRITTNVKEPEIAGSQTFSMERTHIGPDEYTCEHGWLRKAREGWWEMHLQGSPYEIGYAHGLLTKELMEKQERAFLERLREFIPSTFYQRFMLGFTRFFNRDLDEYVLP